MNELLGVMRRLRGPGGCPWDQEQTHESLRPYLMEEAAEAADAVSAGDPAELAGVHGDVLLPVAFHSVFAAETGTFAYADVERAIVDKLVRRHPHVFGETQVAGSDEVVANWQAIKAAEQGGQVRPPSAKVPSGLGALAREAAAQKLAGARPDARAAREALEQALAGADGDAQAVAAVLGAAVAWARALNVDAELALRDRTSRTLAELDRAAGLEGTGGRD